MVARYTRHIRTAATFCCFLVLRLALASPAPAGADNPSTVEISELSGNYRVRMVMLIHAPAQYVNSVLTDYKHIYRLNPAIIESEILPSPHSGTVRVKTRMEGCILFFCRDIDRMEELREVDAGHLQAVIVPEYSDFTAGSADWHIQPTGNDSRIIYEAQVTPAFFIPPIIGSYFVKRTFAEALLTSLARLECIARIRAGLAGSSRQYLADATPGSTDVDAMRTALLAGDDPSVHGTPTSAGAGYEMQDAGCTGTCGQYASGC
jgi:hypothetical protein